MVFLKNKKCRHCDCDDVLQNVREIFYSNGMIDREYWEEYALCSAVLFGWIKTIRRRLV